MSNQSQPIQPSAHTSATICSETINTLAEKLQEVAQRLLELSREEMPASDPDESPKPSKEPDQIRCYRVPGFMVLEEREILDEYRAEDVVDLIRKARDDFSITSLFMRRFSDDYSIDGFTVQHIGESMARPIAMLNKACSICADYEPQELETEPDF